MKRKEGYILRTIGNSYMIVPVLGQSIKVEDMVTLNETGAYLWEHLAEETTQEKLLEALLSEYDVDKETALVHIREFLEKAEQAGILCGYTK